MPEPDLTKPGHYSPSDWEVQEPPTVPPPFDPPAGVGIGRVADYHVLEELASGGMGVVYLAHHPRLGREVALKMIRPRFASDPKLRERFEQEGKRLAQLQCDNVVTVYDAGTHHGEWPYLVMERLRGQTLEQWLEAKEGHRGTVAEALRVAAEILRGLAAMHELKLIHRDIKPANLWVEESGRVKLLDFGLTRGPEDDTTQSVNGTPSFMAPEQARGEKSVGPPADLFSAGAVLYLFLSGRNAFRRDTAAATLTAVQSHEPLPIAAAVPGVPAPLAAFVHRLLSKDATGRPTDARAALNELTAVQQGIAGGAATDRLPPAPTRLFGRDLLLSDVLKKLGDGALVLSGEGGMGKTTLAAAVAHGVRAGGAPVVWVNCEQAGSFVECLREAAAALLGDRCESTPPKQLAARVGDQLTARAALLVMDKFEALKDDAAEAGRWVAELRPPARALVTARAVPSVLAKKVIPVRELSVAHAADLFRVRAADAGVQEPPAADKVAALCERVGYHPLAIELLAVRAARMPLSLLLERVTRSVGELDAGTRTESAPPNGVKACFGESFDALGASHRVLLLAMSVLPAPFGPEVVAVVTGAPDWHDAAAKLVGASLWRVSNERYTVHPLVRQLAHEGLGTRQLAAAQSAAERVTGLAQAKAEAARTSRERSRAYLNWCEAELPNLIALADSAAARKDGATVVGLARALAGFWSSRGYWDVAERLYRAAADAAARDPAAEVWCLEYHGYVCRHLGRFTEAADDYRDALRLCDDNPEATAPHRPLVTARYGKLCAVLDRHDEAVELLTAAVRLSEQAGDADGATAAIVYLAQSYKFAGDTGKALALLDDALKRARRAKDAVRQAECMYQFGNTYLRLNRVAEAERALRDGLKLARDTDDRVRESQCLVGLGLAAAQSGAWPQAEEFWTGGLQLARALGLRLHEGRAMRRVAELLFAKGELGRAREFAREAQLILDESEEDRAKDNARETLERIEAALAAQPAGV